MPIDHTKKFLKSVHTKTLFLEPFSQIFEQLFVNGEQSRLNKSNAQKVVVN